MNRRMIAVMICAVLSFTVWQYFRHRESVPRLVSAIEVEYGDSRQVYQESEQMSRILNKLRSLGQRYAPDQDPEALSGHTVIIRILHSDGTCQQYQIKQDRYIRQGQSQWQQTDPKQIQSLILLLKKSGAFY